jgi:hypothetical protein
MDKVCKKCKRSYAIEEFRTAGSKRTYSACSSCRKSADRDRKKKGRAHSPEKVRLYLIAGMGAKCARCDDDEFYDMLEICAHKVDGGGAKLNRLMMVYAYGGTEGQWGALHDAVQRSVLLCPTCHKAYRMGHFSSGDMEKMRRNMPDLKTLAILPLKREI